MKVSLVLVGHHSSEVMPECVAGFRRAGEEASVETEVVVVEQSDDEAEQLAVGAMGVDSVVVRPNRGYAAGLNTGIEVATGETLLLANPDIRFGEGSLAPLLDGLDGGYDVVGPQLEWNADGEIFFPPAEDPAPSAELRRAARSRWQGAWLRGLPAWLEEIWRVWSADGPVAVPCLRGPLLAVSRATARAFGPFDEDYFLYYEETEWLLRARRSGARFGLVGNSRVAHHWGHSTARMADRDLIEARSRERFFKRNYSSASRWLLQRVAMPRSEAGVSGEEISNCGDLPEIGADLWLVSSFRHLVPSVGCVNRSRLPRGFAEITGSGQWWALAADRGDGAWRTVGSWTWGRA